MDQMRQIVRILVKARTPTPFYCRLFIKYLRYLYQVSAYIHYCPLELNNLL